MIWGRGVQLPLIAVLLACASKEDRTVRACQDFVRSYHQCGDNHYGGSNWTYDYNNDGGDWPPDRGPGPKTCEFDPVSGLVTWNGYAGTLDAFQCLRDGYNASNCTGQAVPELHVADPLGAPAYGDTVICGLQDADSL